MKKILFLLFVCVSFLMQSYAQQIKYTMHTLAKGETLSMLAQKYNTTVGDIMRMNGMHADSKLAEGQKIKIPEAGKTVPKTDGPEATKTTPPPPAPTVAVVSAGNGIHVVQKGETLYSISKKYGITVDNIRQWNQLQNDNIELGQQIAVNSKAIATVREAQEQARQNAATETVAANKVTTETTDVTPEPESTTDAQHADVTTDAAAKAVENKSATQAKQIVVATDGSDNFFAKDFSQSKKSKDLKTVSGAAGIFKTASGWDDKKFYILMNEVATGSIVKVKSTSGNIIYAKVLWPIDEIKANDGLQFRISDAAAAALGELDQKFGLVIQYQ